MHDLAGAVALDLAGRGLMVGLDLAHRHTFIAVALAGLAAAAPAWGTTINYRSIGTDSGILHSTGDASINAGTSVVTFGGGASLPADVGPGDKLVIAGGGLSVITREESVVGSGTSSPVTMASIQGGTDQTYVLFVATASNQDVTNVTGGGLTWTERVEQCGASNGTGMRVYTAQGSPGGAFQAQITYSPGSLALAAVLARYSGVGAIEDPTGENINGEGGACSGGSDNQDAQLTLTSTTDTSVHAVAVASGRRNVVVTAAGYNAIATASGGSAGGLTKIYTYDKSFDPAATEQFTATINSNVDWSTGGVVLSPASGDTTLYVLTRDSATQVTVQETASSTITSQPYEIRRAYNTMPAWESDRQGDLVADDRREVGVCYNDGAFTDQLKISGSTTDATRFMRLTVAEGERHTGLQNTGAVIDAQGGWSNGNAIDVEDEYTRIEWLEIKAIQDQGNGIYFSAGPAGDNGTVSHVIIHSFWQDNPNSGVYVDAAGITIRNCIMTSGSARGITMTAGSATIENCTILGSPGSGHGVSVTSGTVSVMNTISVDHVVGRDFYIETGGTAVITSFGYNMFSNTGGGFDPDGYEGNNQAPPADVEDLFVTAAGCADLHLEGSGLDAADNGLDLSASGGSPIDIDGVTRQLTWDIGAHEVLVHPLTLSYRSIGTNAAVLYSTGTASIDSLSPVVTFSGATLPTNIGQGDELVIGTTTYHILARDSATQVRVQGPPLFFGQLGETYTISRAYNTLQAWEDDRDGNLFSASRQEVGVAYNDGPFSGPLVVDAIMVPDRNMVLTVAQGQRHDGTADTGVRIDAGGGLGTDVVFSDLGAFHIEWFEISNWHDGFDGIEFASGSPMVSTAAYLLIHDFGDASGVGMRIGHDATVWNTIIYDGVGYGIRVATAVGTIQNCTIYGMSLNGVRGNIGSTVDIRNTISVGNALDDFDLRNLITHFGTNMFSTTNTFDPLAYQGYNKSPPSDLENLFISIVPGLEDLHLELTGHKAGNWCTTLSIDFTDDIDGETRSETFDMGADEAITGIATHNILTWQEVEP